MPPGRLLFGIGASTKSGVRAIMLLEEDLGKELKKGRYKTILRAELVIRSERGAGAGGLWTLDRPFWCRWPGRFFGNELRIGASPRGWELVHIALAD